MKLDNRPPRVMWLLNHTAARKFEIPMLKKIGIKEIFLPKIFPSDQSFRSASVDWSEDNQLTIPAEHLAVLNNTDWYCGATADAWQLASKYFDIVFFILHNPNTFIQANKHFEGAIIWRAYGLDVSMSYHKVLDCLVHHGKGRRFIEANRKRFFFGEAYSHLADIEPDYIRRCRVHLPLGMGENKVNNSWEGNDRRILFVCPDLGFNPYYRAIYEDFVADFGDFNYSIAGAQPIEVGDPNVLGFVSYERHLRNMTQSRVMFYNSREPRHIHYHPFEAIRTGMPLIFMAEGMLDRMGGQKLPGRCRTLDEARDKIKRILNDDWKLINQIRESQTVLLEPMKPENCETTWRENFQHIINKLAAWRSEKIERPLVHRRKRIAVILPIAYRGGTLRGAQLLAEALYLGSRQKGEAAEIVLLHPDEPEFYNDETFAALPDNIECRPFHWNTLTATEARRAMRYAGFAEWEPTAERYVVPDDRIHQIQECDLWLFVSDRLSIPILPLKPVVLMVYDYLQRYEAILPRGADQPFLNAARSAELVLVTTDFTYRDALQYAGIEPCKVRKLPMLAPAFPLRLKESSRPVDDYFIWTTNAAPHKNHGRAAEGLRIYYEELDGRLSCWVTGVNTKGLLDSELPHFKEVKAIFGRSKALRKRVKWKGELPEAEYRRGLCGALFLWHAGRIDNGTFSVVEAACVGVPSLSSDYPAMREMNEQFSLNLAWMDPYSPRHMAEQLKHMETEAAARRELLPHAEEMTGQRVEALALSYWEGVRECL